MALDKNHSLANGGRHAAGTIQVAGERLGNFSIRTVFRFLEGFSNHSFQL
jgi:hypothetical protein